MSVKFVLQQESCSYLVLQLFFAVFYDQNIKLAFLVVAAFWVDFVLKVFFGPGWSYIGWIGARIVRKQKPEYVGAIQKRFAWSIGLGLSSIVLVLVGKIVFFFWGCVCSINVGIVTVFCTDATLWYLFVFYVA